MTESASVQEQTAHQQMSALAMGLLGVLWGLLGAAKLASPADLAEYLSSYVPQAEVAAAAIGVAEGLLGVSSVACAVLLARGTGCPLTKGMVAASTFLALASVVAALLLPARAQCGCFGAIAEASTSKRLIVAGAILALGGTAWSDANAQGRGQSLPGDGGRQGRDGAWNGP